MTSGGNTKSRNARRQPKRTKGSGKSNPNTQHKKKKQNKKKSKDADNNRILAEFGSCGVLFAKANQDPFHFVNSTTELPCVPKGPKVKTQRHCAYFRGTFSTGSGGRGFLIFAPFRIASNAGDPYKAAYHTDSGFSGTNYSTTPGPGVVGQAFTQSTTLVAHNPHMRVVAAGIRVSCIGPPLYMGGRMAYAQKVDFTDTWNTVPIDNTFSMPDAVSHHITPQKKTFSWVFSSSLPGHVQGGQGEFTMYSELASFSCHNMAIGISGATGSGAGLPFEYEIVSIYEVSAYNNGTEIVTPPDGIFTDTSAKAADLVPEVVKKHRGDVTETNNVRNFIKHMAGPESPVTRLQAAHTALEHLSNTLNQ